MADILVTGADNILREVFAAMRANAPAARRVQVRITATDIVSAPTYETVTPDTKRTLRTPQGAKSFSVGIFADGVDIAVPVAPATYFDKQNAIPNMVALWDTETLPSGADGTLIAQNWVDSKSSIPMAFDPTASRQMQLYNNVLGGKKMMRSTDSARGMNFGRPAQLINALTQQYTDTGYTMFFVLRPEGNSVFNVFFSPNSIADNGRCLQLNGDIDGPRGNQRTTPGGNFGFRVVAVRCSQTAADGPAGRPDSREAFWYLGWNIRNTGVVMDAHGSNDYWLGAPASNPTAGMRGYYGDVLLYNRELTNVEMLTVMENIYDKYGQTVPWAAQTLMLGGIGDSYTQSIGLNSWFDTICANNSVPFLSRMNMGVGSRTPAQCTSRIVRDWQGVKAKLRERAPGCKFVASFQGYANYKQTSAADIGALSTLLASTAPEITTIGFNAWSDATPAVNTTRAAYNVAFLTGTVTASFKFDISPDTTIGIDGACPPSGFPTTNFADGTAHLTTAGNTYFAGAINATFNTAIAAAT